MSVISLESQEALFEIVADGMIIRLRTALGKGEIVDPMDAMGDQQI